MKLEGQELPFESVAYEHTDITHTYIIIEELLNVPQELNNEIVYCVPRILILELLSFLTKVLNTVWLRNLNPGIINFPFSPGLSNLTKHFYTPY